MLGKHSGKAAYKARLPLTLTLTLTLAFGIEGASTPTPTPNPNRNPNPKYNPHPSPYKARLIDMGYDDVANDPEALRRLVDSAKAIADKKKVHALRSC